MCVYSSGVVASGSRRDYLGAASLAGVVVSVAQTHKELLYRHHRRLEPGTFLLETSKCSRCGLCRCRRCLRRRRRGQMPAGVPAMVSVVALLVISFAAPVVGSVSMSVARSLAAPGATPIVLPGRSRPSWSQPRSHGLSRSRRCGRYANIGCRDVSREPARVLVICLARCGPCRKPPYLLCSSPSNVHTANPAVP